LHLAAKFADKFFVNIFQEFQFFSGGRQSTGPPGFFFIFQPFYLITHKSTSNEKT